MTNQGSVRLRFAYDYMSRRVEKEVETWTGMEWSNVVAIAFTYDGWNMIRETRSDESKPNYYVWGLDLSGTLQGAGGVGGLLARVRQENIPHPLYYACDANGNITDVLNQNGTLAAHYEYDPFGNTIAQSGDLAETNPFRFSSKYWHGESGIYYYGFRYYSPEVGRWVSRDPMGEIKLNLYEALLNDPNRYIDVNGLDIFGGGQNDVPPTAVSPPTYMGPHPFTGDIPTTLSEGKDPPCSGNIYTAVFSPCPCPKGLKCVLDIQRLVERRCMTEILPGLGAGGAPVLQPSPGGGIVGPDLSPEYIPVYGPWMLRQVLTWEKCVPECVDCSVRTLPPWEGGIPNPIVRITDTITECSL